MVSEVCKGKELFKKIVEMYDVEQDDVEVYGFTERHASSIVRQLASALQSSVHPLIEKGNATAQHQLEILKSNASNDVNSQLHEELMRLKSLKQLNPNVREEELFYLEQQKVQLLEHVAKAELKLDAIRLIVVSH